MLGGAQGDHVMFIYMNRLSKLLRDELGSDWREKLPVPTDHEMVMKAAQPANTIPPPPPGQQQSSDNIATTSAKPKPSAEPTKEQHLKKYEELKEKGNAHVKKVCMCKGEQL